MSSGAIGERIAAYRRRRGLSQAALAGLIGRSESWLSQVERGVRSVDRLSVLLDMARVLHVEVEALTGGPTPYSPNGSQVVEGLETVRRYLARYDSLTGASVPESVGLVQVRAQVTGAHKLYQAAKYEEVIAELPGVLRGADALHRSAAGSGRREALGVYASAYAVAAKLLTKLGANELALLVADRSATAAVEADSLEARGLAAYQVACALLRLDRPEDAEDLAVAMAVALRREARSDQPVLVSVAGALWLIAAVIASRRQDRGEASRRLDAAEELAGILGEDGNHAWTAFGPTNVAIHRVSVAAEFGDPSGALQASEGVDPDRLPAGLDSRRVSVIGTPASAAWLDDEAITRLTGEPPRLEFRPPSQPKRTGSPSAVVVCPATFNTINKAAAGINDTYALGVVCEALGAGLPVLAVPMVNNKLWGHPAWAGSLEVMKKAGVVLVDVVSGGEVPTPVASGTGDRVVAAFDPLWVTARVARLVAGRG